MDLLAATLIVMFLWAFLLQELSYKPCYVNFFESFEDKIKLKYLETIKQQEQENYKLLTLSYKQVREFKHDIENQFLVLNDMLENNDTDSAKEYLVKLSSFVRLANRLCYTG